MKKLSCLPILFLLILYGCYPSGPDTTEELDLVYTNYSPEYDCLSKGSYAMPDSIVKITGDLAEGKDPEFVKDPYSSAILARIDSNMRDLGDYISKASFRGAIFEYRKPVSSNIFIGADIGWNVFYERKDHASYSMETATISGIQFRFSNEIPFLISGEYFINPGSSISPYVGYGLGTMYSVRFTEMGLYSISEDAWHFAIKPEIGFIKEINHTMGFKMAVRYNTGFKAGDLETQSYPSLSLGFTFM